MSFFEILIECFLTTVITVMYVCTYCTDRRTFSFCNPGIQVECVRRELCHSVGGGGGGGEGGSGYFVVWVARYFVVLF